MIFRLLALVSCVLCAASCKPTVGSSCHKGEARCVDATTELACQGESFVETPCRGPRGCSATAQGTACDVTANKPGDPCSTDEEGAAVCPRPDGMLACHGGHYALLPCRGREGCRSGEGGARCDSSSAEPGDVCPKEEDKACSSDGREVLICKQHTMQRFYQCRGLSGCIATSDKLSCDNSIAKPGDACDKKLEGRALACTPDAKAVLVCKGGAFVLQEGCGVGLPCAQSAGGTGCAAPSRTEPLAK